jgi:hypothetical protein
MAVCLHWLMVHFLCCGWFNTDIILCHADKVRHLQERLELDRKQQARESHHARLSHSDSHPGSHASPNVKHRGNIVGKCHF